MTFIRRYGFYGKMNSVTVVATPIVFFPKMLSCVKKTKIAGDQQS